MDQTDQGVARRAAPVWLRFVPALVLVAACSSHPAAPTTTTTTPSAVEISIFMLPEATAGQTTAVEQQLSRMPEVGRFTYVDQAASYKEFRVLFAHTPNLLNSVTPKDLPPSFRIVPARPGKVGAIYDRFNGWPGVKEVVLRHGSPAAVRVLNR